jgi:ABC-type multidrug transport system permease subunit
MNGELIPNVIVAAVCLSLIVVVLVLFFKTKDRG